MKNLQLLPIDSEISKKIEASDKAYRRFIQVGCDILAVKDFTITVRIAQLKNLTGKILTAKELVEKGREVFSHLPEGFTIHFRALTWKGEGIDLVGPDWVRNQAKKYGLTQKELAISMNIDEPHISKLMKGGFGFTNAWKAAFYYYFQTLSHASSVQS